MNETRFLVYSRVSTAAQVDGDGPVRQEEVCRKFAEAKGWVFRGSYFDGGVSGATSCVNRPQFAKLLNDCPKREIRTIVVERADRIARDLIESELLIRECKAMGIEIWCADSGEELVFSPDQDPTRVLIRQIMGALSEWEKNVIVKKLQAGRRKMIAETGRCGGHEPYSVPAVIEIIWRAGQAGCKFAAIARDLNKLEIESPKGKLWSPKTVKRILKREVTLRAKL